MNCSECGGESRVVNSRKFKHYIRRRRECIDCDNRWTTKETKIIKVTRNAKGTVKTITLYDPINDIIG